MKSILEVEKLKKDFGSFGLKSVSFSLEENCITGFIGINGAGKTTTIKTILGQILKDSGTIKLFGKDIESNEKEIKNKIGVVLDEGYFYNHLSLKEMKNIIAPAYKNWDEEIFKSYINKFNLKLNQKIETLSKGMRMKYSIALALSHKAEFLIMDEPTSGLDPLIRTELMNILLEFMKNGGKGVFFSTHITSDLEKVADKLILINKGQIIFNERKETLINSYRIVKGKKGLLSNEMKHSFITFNDYGDDFEGITVDKSIFNKQIDALTLIQPTIEDIMLAYIEGRSCECLTF
jgi:ABC-2 type transport system ATP-binding protein